MVNRAVAYGVTHGLAYINTVQSAAVKFDLGN